MFGIRQTYLDHQIIPSSLKKAGNLHVSSKSESLETGNGRNVCEVHRTKIPGDFIEIFEKIGRFLIWRFFFNPPICQIKNGSQIKYIYSTRYSIYNNCKIFSFYVFTYLYFKRILLGPHSVESFCCSLLVWMSFEGYLTFSKIKPCS